MSTELERERVYWCLECDEPVELDELDELEGLVCPDCGGELELEPELPPEAA